MHEDKMVTLQDRLQPVEIRIPNLLLEYGPCPSYRTESGRTITLLPTLSVPETHLIEENYDPFCARVESGNFRRVRWIYKLANGEKSSIYVKGPNISLALLEYGGEAYVQVKEQSMSTNRLLMNR